MYKLTLILFAFFSLVFPILAIPIPDSNEFDGGAQNSTTGAVTSASFRGRGTYYSPGLGACGNTNSEKQLVIAISGGIYGAPTGIGPHCGQKVNIRYGGTSVQATVVDKCPSCGDQDIDMSPTLFEKFAKLGVGVIQVTWNFV